MSARFFILLPALLAAGCARDKGGDDTHSDSPPPDDSGDDTGAPSLGVFVDHSGQGVALVLVGGEGSYTFGMAETDPNNPDPWTGEDCHRGYTDSDGDLYLSCHPADATGVTLLDADSIDLVVAGETTYMTNIGRLVTTYMLTHVESGQCWVWGHDTPYYQSYGCAEIEPSG